MAGMSWCPRWENDISELTFEGVVGQSQIGTVGIEDLGRTC